VLIVGGVFVDPAATPVNTFLGSAELYDPKSGKFTPSASLSAARSYPSATLLPDGQVLIAGGGNDSATLGTAELFDYSTGSFTLTGSMTQVRAGQTAMLLPDGRVLIVGGAGGSGPLVSAELYQP